MNGIILTSAGGSCTSDQYRIARTTGSPSMAKTDAAFAAGAALAAVSLLVLGWLTFVAVPPVELTLERRPDGTVVVAEVPVAGPAWQMGIEPGMRVEGFVSPSGDPSSDWQSLLLTDGSLRTAIQRYDLPPDPPVFVFGLLGLLSALVLQRVAPTVAWWLLLLPAATSLAVASRYVPAALGFGLTLAPPVIGALSVADPLRRPHRLAPLIAVVAVIVAASGWLAAYVLRFESWDVPRQLSGAIAVGLLALGTTAVAREAMWRGRARLERHGLADPSPAELLAATVDELVPGRSRSRLQAIERERASLAGDLHAGVLPELAAVIRSVDAGLDPAQAAARLRTLVDELRELMTERRLSVLDELGLVPALEWLAERIEERTTVRVEIDVWGDEVARAPREVELATYRIAQQAIDNALVHARPTVIRLGLEISESGLKLEVSDDGSGIVADADARAARRGRLGLADMRSRAAAIGGAFWVDRRPEGGTTAALRWPA